jgi:hypothetical protein
MDDATKTTTTTTTTAIEKAVKEIDSILDLFWQLGHNRRHEEINSPSKNEAYLDDDDDDDNIIIYDRTGDLAQELKEADLSFRGGASASHQQSLEDHIIVTNSGHRMMDVDGQVDIVVNHQSDDIQRAEYYYNKNNNVDKVKIATATAAEITLEVAMGHNGRPITVVDDDRNLTMFSELDNVNLGESTTDNAPYSDNVDVGTTTPTTSKYEYDSLNHSITATAAAAAAATTTTTTVPTTNIPYPVKVKPSKRRRNKSLLARNIRLAGMCIFFLGSMILVGTLVVLMTSSSQQQQQQQHSYNSSQSNSIGPSPTSTPATKIDETTTPQPSRMESPTTAFTPFDMKTPASSASSLPPRHSSSRFPTLAPIDMNVVITELPTTSNSRKDDWEANNDYNDDDEHDNDDEKDKSDKSYDAGKGKSKKGKKVY